MGRAGALKMKARGAQNVPQITKIQPKTSKKATPRSSFSTLSAVLVPNVPQGLPELQFDRFSDPFWTQNVTKKHFLKKKNIEIPSKFHRNFTKIENFTFLSKIQSGISIALFLRLSPQLGPETHKKKRAAKFSIEVGVKTSNGARKW